MVHDIPIFFVIAVMLIVLYPVISAVVLALTEQARMKFADAVRALLVDPTVSENHKIFLTTMVDDVFDWRFMAYATFWLPFVAFTGRVEREMTPDDRLFFARSDVENMMGLHRQAVMGASPAFSILFYIVLALTLVLALAFIGMSVFTFLWADTVKNVSPNVGARTAQVKVNN